MRTYNAPSATESTATSGYTPTPKRDNKNIFIALLAAGLLGSLGYIWYSKKEEKATDTKQEQQLLATTTAKDEVQTMYNQALVRLDSITNLNTTLNGEITNKDGIIGKLKMDIENDIRTITALRKEGKNTSMEEASLRSKINKLNSEIDGYKTKITELEQQNQVLTAENTVVKRERDSVGTELGTTRTKLDETTTQKKTLEDQVDVGATLNASNFSIAGINERRNGKEKETDKAKKVDKLRIGFDLDANRITQTGKKEIFVCLTSPDGKPVTVEALGSGQFKTREEGDKFFTNKIDVDYTQGQKKYVNFDWKQNSDFQRGDYKVEVYQNGFKIGEGKVTLKKSGLFG